uniref:Uncharacterized protein n=1 Tax=Anguilla anguilla TaxID=7936 RepID=A0A0E9QCA6_ANGAN
MFAVLKDRCQALLKTRPGQNLVYDWTS